MSAALEQWHKRFEKDAPKAVGDLLGNRVYLGFLSQAESPEALQYIYSGLDKAGQHKLDGAVRTWLQQVTQAKSAIGLGYDHPKVFARMLVHTLQSAGSLNLRQTLTWMGGNNRQGEMRDFLAEHYFGQSCDPLGAYYASLGLRQEDRQLLRLWLEIATLSNGGFNHYGQLGLDGLLRMPDQAGQGSPGRISEPLLVGLLHFARGLSRLNRGKAELDSYVEYLRGAYPMSEEAWRRKLLEARRQVKLDQQAEGWMRHHFPDIFTENGGRDERAAQDLPSESERRTMQQRLEKEPMTVPFRAELVQFFDRYREYTKKTGDSYYLVRTFNSFGTRLLSKHIDPVWVAELAQEAATWEPYHAHSWSLLGRALDDAGDWRRAEAVFWQARRRFPYNAVSHNQLGSALAQRGETEAALAVLEDAVRFFPANAVGRVSKAYALLWAGEEEGALAELDSALQFCPDISVYVAKASLLMQQGQLDAAGLLLEQARAMYGSDHKLQQTERELQHRRDGHNTDRTLQPRPTGRDSSPDTLTEITGKNFGHAPNLGKATAFRRVGNYGAAKEHLEQVSHSEQRCERGLLIWQEKGTTEAADYFVDQLATHPGDAALLLHHGRSCQRTGREVNWDHLKARFPELEAVILTEKDGQAPGYAMPSEEEEGALAHGERQRGWFAETWERDEALRDPLAEEFIAAYRA